MGLYFRGHTYENTLYNRIIANFLTFLYRAKIEIVYYIETYWLRFVLLSLLVLSLCACTGQKTFSLPHVAPDTCVVDSQSVHRHDYLIFYRPAKTYAGEFHLEPFQILHSPDCYCRYNRKFIIVKRQK